MTDDEQRRRAAAMMRMRKVYDRRIMKTSLIAAGAALLIASSLFGQDWAKHAVDASPRHHEWVNVKSGDHVAGFCWGGTQAFRFATNRPSLTAAYVFYGTGPESADAIAAIKAPVYGFYAGNDARVGATVPATQQMMKAAGKSYEPVTYDGAGHGFMRAGEAPPPPATADEKTSTAYTGNKKARDDAWARWTKLLAR